MNYKEIMLRHEKDLSDYACKDSDAIRLFGNLSDDLRPNYFRDTDRIIYSLLILDISTKPRYFPNNKMITYPNE